MATNQYFKDNPDVAKAYEQYGAGTSPDQFSEQHYYQFGINEGRAAPTTTNSYLDSNPDVLAAYQQQAGGLGADGIGAGKYSVDHYDKYGRFEGRDSPFSDPNLTRQYNDLQKQFQTLQSTSNSQSGAFKEQLAQLQSQYEKLLRKNIDGGGGIVGGGVVPGDGSVIGGGGITDGAGQGTGGVVYGPDGTSYSSPAAALAAGVSNFSYTPPSSNQGGNTNGPTTPTAPNQFMQGGYQTGNSNPGGLISGATDQLFYYGRPSVGFPYGG